jgi:hypothetical protein
MALLVLAGCNGSGAEKPKHGAGTVSATVSSAPTMTSTTPSASVSDSVEQAKADLRSAQAAYYSAYMAAAAKPSNDAAVQRLLNVYKQGSPGQRGMRKYMKTLAKSGFAARSGPESTFVVQKVNVSSVAEGATASVLVCTYDDGVTYDAKHDGPDGKPIVIDDSISSARTTFAYQREGGSWKITGGDVQKTWAGENHCTSKT